MNILRQLKTPHPTPINYLYHISDIHIRNHNRHAEYRNVFENLYQKLEEEDREGLIIITGDVVHSKSQISPQLIIELRNFLSNLTDIMPVIMIAGNHDLNLSNRDVPDTLSSILHKMDIPNLYYLKDSGIYQWNNILFGVMSVLDYPLITADEFPDVELLLEDENGQDVEIKAWKVGLLHATLHGSKIATSTQPLTSDKYKAGDFEGYDCVLLGDIHLHQYMNAKRTIAYAGSLVQQSFGEEIGGHGYLKWTLNGETGEVESKLVEVRNPHGFLNLQVRNNRVEPRHWVEAKSSVPPYVNLKIKMMDESPHEIAESFVRDLQVRGVNILQNMIVPYTPSLQTGDETAYETEAGELLNLSNMSYQMTLFEEFLGDHERVEDIQDLHDRLSKEIGTIVEGNCYQWHLLSMEFQNAFSFTGTNFIDFTSFDGIVGVIGPNFSGKSNILDIMLFGLFDRASRGERSDIITANHISMFIKINFRIGNRVYTIHRSGKITKSNTGDKAKIDVRFYTGEEELTGENRHETNKIIQNYIGNYDDFILTTLKLQNASAGNLITMSNSQRKEKLVELLRLNLFDEFYKLAYGQLRDQKKEVDLYVKELKSLPDDLNQQLEGVLDELIEDKRKLNIVKLNLDLELTRLSELNGQLQPVDLKLVELEYRHVDKVDPVEIRKLDGELNQLGETIAKLNSQITKLVYNMTKDELEDNMDLYDEEIHEREEMIEKAEQEEQDQRVLLEGLVKRRDIDRKELVDWNKLWERKIHLREWIAKCKDNNQKLLKLEYDQECRYCMNNIFVKDAIKCRDELEDREDELDELEAKLLEMESVKESLENTEKEISEIHETLSRQNVYKMEKELTTLKEEFQQLEEDLKNLRNNTKYEAEVAELEAKREATKELRDELWDKWELRQLMDKIKVEQDKEESNQGIRKKISELSDRIGQMKAERETFESSVMRLSAQEQVLGTKIERFRELTKKIKDLREDNELLELYCRCLNKDGIPKFLIEKYLPEFERVVNLIMQDLVRFRIKMEIGEKKWNLYVVYPDRRLNLDLCSGYEKFVVGLAIKCALTHLSQVSKPQFMVVDEGFGTLDGRNLQEIGKILSFLRSKYDFILLITHIEAIKDELDTQLEITREGAYSRVNNKAIRKVTIKKRS